MTDLRKYRELIQTFQIPSLDEDFEILHALEKIYLGNALFHFLESLVVLLILIGIF